jgi:putative ABC transport system substrate-binding protein
MRRREFITLLAGSVVVRPSVVHAQKMTMPNIGVLVGLPEGDPEGESWAKALFAGLSDLGWKPNVNIRINLRFAAVDADRDKLAIELVDLKPDVIHVSSTPATAAVLRATRTIPVVFSNVSDPITPGFVQSFPRPGGNATGFVNIEASIGGKWLDLLKEIAPNTSRVLIIFNPKTAPQSYFYLKPLKASAPSFGLTLSTAEVSSADQIETAIRELAKIPNGGLVVTPDVFTGAQAQRDLIVSLVTRNQIPTVYSSSLFVKAGGLLSYGTDYSDLMRRAASYVDLILKGAKPQDLPVQLPTKFDLAINTDAAKKLGWSIPARLLASANEIIE